jgi:cation:H+ antiporter
MQIVWFLLGLGALVAGAEALVRGAAKLASSFGVSPLVIGLTIVSIGTSAPEVAVSVQASMSGRTDIAVGNVVGSNLFNVLFILGLSALIIPLVVHAQIIRQEIPVMVGSSVLLAGFVLDGELQRWEAVVLLALFVAYIVFLIRQSRAEEKAHTTDLREAEVPDQPHWLDPLPVQLGLIVAGLGMLVLGSRLLVSAATDFAEALGVSDVVIGLTIVAAGTSLPEVATSVTAAIRKQRDIAVGNVIGSNTFNILACLGLSGALAKGGGLGVAESIRNFDLWVMLAVAVACLPIALTGRAIARWEGAVFLAYYAAYTGYLILDSQDHDALGTYSTVMMSFVVPITVITIVVAVLRDRSANGGGGAGTAQGVVEAKRSS